jgi:hypothetical protein
MGSQAEREKKGGRAKMTGAGGGECLKYEYLPPAGNLKNVTAAPPPHSTLQRIQKLPT